MYWISGTGPFDVSSSAWGPDHLSKFIVIPAVLKASIAARSLSVCQRRLWSFIKASDRLEVDLPAIVSMTSRMPLDRERQHHECTEEFCRFNNVNSTWVRQLHKCGNKACSETFFPPAEVERAVLQNLLTAWTIRQAPEVNCHDGTYMALSHLWADGTGIGLEKPGKLNRCLIDYFVGIARRLECDGIWWDTICVPIEPGVRRKALSMMHKNFERAKCTVVHDESLINYEWRDDGSPCLALALSPWFTRCWTALELYVSTKVVVLFKNPDGKSSQPLLKDLDNDILANDNAYTSLPHRLASSVIQRLRRRKRKERLHVEDLLAILRARNTSWATDRMIVAGLMAELPEFDSGESQSQITRKILTKCGLIPSSYLLHSHISPNEYGPWSWCPTSLYDLHSDLASKNSQLSLKIRHDGTATGDWFCNTLTEEKAKLLQLHNPQMSVKLRIMKTMQTPRSCMILRPWPWLSSEVGNQCLLVETVGLGYDETRSKVIECRYIGTVTASIHLGWQYVSIRIGLDQGKEEVDAQEMVSACSLEENAGQMLDEGINRVISRMRADEFASIEDVRDLTWALTGLRDQSL
ncbi:hypothetical protein EPUS_08475 [Endocarpon pusillum Z07020]|uniref:Heterokaryon incompatibility domain-containing protein n=1 Tax=Endocarpon pusillum (strain Z07020 / HMAS-L-300199) TaxID=1263415 RepID=U1G673_ENDPU|nr:uncharacterized protein EPUS_08475 [Endocarpon pusillum Z07020]ERF72862.1 hypothetical protein EPUS_08475 [Endocarpon pusillum Z07020]